MSESVLEKSFGTPPSGGQASEHGQLCLRNRLKPAFHCASWLATNHFKHALGQGEAGQTTAPARRYAPIALTAALSSRRETG
jgi:hypothetical protein